MTVTTLDETVAIVATRAEWARVIQTLSSNKVVHEILSENPDTQESINAITDTPPINNILDAIVVCNIDTILRLEKSIPVNNTTVKVFRSSTSRRPAWDVRT